MRKLTLLLEDDVYDGLQRVAGRGNIGHFVSEKVRPYLVAKKQGAATGFGMLSHLARKMSPAEEAEARRSHFEERYRRKNAGTALK